MDSSQVLQVRVTGKTAEALDIASFELVPMDTEALPSFAAGAHIDVHTPNGLIRQYSLCGRPGDTARYRIAVLNETDSRGGSRAMHEAVHEGDVLKISAPRNHFGLAEGASKSILLAGGIGVTPILAMAQRLAEQGAVFELHYCARSRVRAAFVDEMQLAGFAARLQCHFDDGPEDQRANLAQILGMPSPGHHVYVCGPKGFMDAVLTTARDQGWPESSLHYEFFSAVPIKASTDDSFEVQIASSGRLVTVPKEQTVVQALAAVGVAIPISCEQGVCGTCLTGILAGEPDHRDMYLSPEEKSENKQFMPCCSRAKSQRLVLDL